MTTYPPILSVCSDSWLAQTRHEVLAKHFEVFTVAGVKDVHHVPSSTPFQVILICHSLPADECLEVESFARLRWREARILALTSLFSSCCLHHPDGAVAGLDGPRLLIAAIRRLLGANGSEGQSASNLLAGSLRSLGDRSCSQAESPLASERIEFGKR